MRKTLKLGLVIVIATLAIVGATLVFRVGQPLSEDKAVELAEGYAIKYFEWPVPPPLFGRKIEDVKLHIAVLSPIERITELTFFEQDKLAKHVELPDKMWVVEFLIAYTWLGESTVEQGRVRVVIDAYTGDKLSVFELGHFPSFARGS